MIRHLSTALAHDIVPLKRTQAEHADSLTVISRRKDAAVEKEHKPVRSDDGVQLRLHWSLPHFP